MKTYQGTIKPEQRSQRDSRSTPLPLPQAAPAPRLNDRRSTR